MSDILILCERHIVKPNNPLFSECDNLSFLAKNLYNSTLYYQRQSLFESDFQNYYAVNREFTHTNQPDYRALPAKVSKQVQMLVDKNFKSYFALVKKKNTEGYSPKVKPPKYLDKTEGRCTVPYPKDALSLKVDGYVKFSKTSIMIKTNIPKKDIRGARIIPKGNHYVIEILYRVVSKPLRSELPTRVAFIDPGLNNLMTVTSNCFNPILINGRPLKAINQLANKEIANLKSRLSVQGLHTSPLLQSVYNKRARRIIDMLHKITTQLVNHLDSHNIDTVIFGHNVGQKQDINLGKVTNQNFVQIPFTHLIAQLQYKCQLKGIRFIVTEESHTSKCSFLDKESIEHHDKYKGKRVKRGLFKTSEGIFINADVNGSLNIGRKYLINLGLYTSELHRSLIQFMVNPKLVKFI